MREQKKHKIKIDYQRWTFLLSVIGFIGSVGFYIGVLRQVYGPSAEKQKIEELRTENHALKEAVKILIIEKNDDQKGDTYQF